MARAISGDTLALRLSESLSARLPPRTPRDVWLPRVGYKALAVIGVRRGGKTSFLERHIADRLAAGDPPGTHLLLSLEDERLVGMTAEDLGWLLEERKRVVSNVRARGRSMEVLVHPFSFREALRHAGNEPTEAWARLSPDERAEIDAALRPYSAIGGFPEAQRIDVRDRMPPMQSYVELMLLRDIIERHRVTNVEALRRLQRHLLANPAGSFSVSKFHRDLRSHSLPVAGETLHQLLQHLEDAFMVRLVGMHTASERQRMRNPRKVYPVDPGLIPVVPR
jgi:uncharacterized protein